MSSPLVSRSPDLQRLHQEGYDIEIRSGYLLVKHVPFATSAREVAFGTLISELSTTGTATTRPADHVVCFAGGIPCDQHGNQLSKIINSTERTAPGRRAHGGLQILQQAAGRLPRLLRQDDRLREHAQRLRAGHRPDGERPVADAGHDDRGPVGVPVPGLGLQPGPDQPDHRQARPAQGRDHRTRRHRRLRPGPGRQDPGQRDPPVRRRYLLRAQRLPRARRRIGRRPRRHAQQGRVPPRPVRRHAPRDHRPPLLSSTSPTSAICRT